MLWAGELDRDRSFCALPHSCSFCASVSPKVKPRGSLRRRCCDDAPVTTPVMTGPTTEASLPPGFQAGLSDPHSITNARSSESMKAAIERLFIISSPGLRAVIKSSTHLAKFQLSTQSTFNVDTLSCYIDRMAENGRKGPRSFTSKQ